MVAYRETNFSKRNEGIKFLGVGIVTRGCHIYFSLAFLLLRTIMIFPVYTLLFFFFSSRQISNI